MNKAVISNKIYMNIPEDKEVLDSITKALTYKIVKNKGKKFTAVETIRNYKRITGGFISIPQARSDLIPEGYEVIDKRILAPVAFPEPLHDLYPDQQVVYDEINDTCIINALVGWGKSYTALYVARKLGQKTLIVVHTLALLDQWRDGIKSLFGVDSGIIAAKGVDYEGHAFTVTNVQTFKKYAEKLSKTFGAIIVDEAHHLPSTTFTGILGHMHARYYIGLSGTLIRKDQKHVLFQDYFGSHILKPPQSNTLDPKILVLKTDIALKTGIPWTDRITELTGRPSFQNLVADIAKIQIAKGHKVLIIADRVEFLVRLTELIGNDCVTVTGAIGDRNVAKEQIETNEKKCIAGARLIFAEGISISPLSCVILAVPINNDSLLEQIIGRIMRLCEGKLDPEVVDIQLGGYADRTQNTSRMGLYLRKGWEISTLDNKN